MYQIIIWVLTKKMRTHNIHLFYYERRYGHFYVETPGKIA